MDGSFSIAKSSKASQVITTEELTKIGSTVLDFAKVDETNNLAFVLKKTD